LEIYGIIGISKNLYSQYLKDSLKDNVSHCSEESNWSKILHGIPQGSALGPLLFLLYINNLPVATEESAMTILFADDTSLIVTDKNRHKT
jgi:hypothetical protein